MDQNTANKIVYWQEMHREAGKMLTSHFKNNNGNWSDYWSGADWAYVKAWQERQAFCYRSIVKHRGF